MCSNIAKAHKAGLLLMSTSRVYSIHALDVAAAPIGRRCILSGTNRLSFPRRHVEPRHRRGLLHTRAHLALWQHQAGCRSAGARIWGRLRLSGLDQPLRRAGWGGAVRNAGPGCLLLLDSRPRAPPPTAIHRFRWDRQTNSETSFIRAISRFLRTLRSAARAPTGNAFIALEEAARTPFR
jgi:hypothetical protein